MLNFKFCKQCGFIFYRNKKYSQKQWEAKLCCSRKCGATRRDISLDADICKMYLDGVSSPIIAKKHNTSDTNVRRILKRNNIYIVKNRARAGGLSLTDNGYLRLHKSKSNGAIGGRRLHDLILEMKIGRSMRRNEVCHHVDEDKLNNHPDNLELMDRGSHTRLHKKGKSNAKPV